MNHSRFLVSLALVTAAAATAACSVASNDAEADGAGASSAAINLATTNYLALGDSVPFGMNPLLLPTATNPALPTEDQFVGYPEVLARLVAPLRDANLACPGETSSSFLLPLSSFDPASPLPFDRGCHLVKAAGILHVPYVESQLARAMSFLSTHPQTKLVTLTVGGNDMGLVADICKAQVEAGVAAGQVPYTQAAAAVAQCVGAALPQALGTLQANVTRILSGVRGTGYKGELMAVTYYSLNYNQPAGTDLLKLANDVLAGTAAGFGAKVADGYAAFKVASGPAGDPCAAGLLIRLPTPAGAPISCDVHPSPTGREVLGAAVRAAMAKHI